VELLGRRPTVLTRLLVCREFQRSVNIQNVRIRPASESIVGALWMCGLENRKAERPRELNLTRSVPTGFAEIGSELRSIGRLKGGHAYRAFCLTVNVCPAIVIVPERRLLVLATE
jgi:hypothetical protein